MEQQETPRGVERRERGFAFVVALASALLLASRKPVMADFERVNKEQLEAEKLSGSQRLESDNSSLVSVIPERKLTWKEATLLLLTEYVVL